MLSVTVIPGSPADNYRIVTDSVFMLGIVLSLAIALAMNGYNRAFALRGSAA